MITIALNELHIRNLPQFSILGGGYLGGAVLDWLLPEYNVDLEYNGPFHETSGGSTRDQLRNIGGISRRGLRVEKLRESDLWNLKPRILYLIGRKG